MCRFDFVSDPSTEGAFFLPLMEQYLSLKPMVSLKGFDTVPSHALTPPPKAARSANGGGKSGAQPRKDKENVGKSNGNAPAVGGAGNGANVSAANGAHAVVNGFNGEGSKRGQTQLLGGGG